MSSNPVPPIRIDPETGQKLFNTRAEKASDRIAGKGYDVVSDQELLALPKFKADAAFDDEQKALYRDFNEVRQGTDDYMKMEGTFARYLEDHYTEAPIARESLTDECEIIVVGAGFAGLLLWYRLSKEGFTNIRFCERGGDVGGTW